VNTDGTGFVKLHTFTNAFGSAPKEGLALSGSTLYCTTSDGVNGLTNTRNQRSV